MSNEVTINRTVGWFQEGKIQEGKVVKKINGSQALVRNKKGEHLIIKNVKLRLIGEQKNE